MIKKIKGFKMFILRDEWGTDYLFTPNEMIKARTRAFREVV